MATVDPEKLRELAYTLSDDQKRLLREGLAGGGNLDPDSLRTIFNSSENREILRELAAEDPDAQALEPPLTRW
jgi:hypothetical protein